MALTAAGTLIVGTRRQGKVYAVPDALTDAQPRVVTLLRGLAMPSGIALHEEDLYIGATNEIIRIPDIDDHLVERPPTELVTDELPDKRHHGWKYLKFGPDKHLYVPVGAPCNICLSKDPRFATLLRMDPTTGTTQVWASGIRNTVGFAWHPQSGALWFTDNGRDLLGDDVPPEEVNVAERAGQHFGYPFVHGTGIRDPKFGEHQAADGLILTPPTIEIQAHSAALGMAFNTGSLFPAPYHNALFIAEHGSWNRSEKVGYRVSVLTSTASGLEYAVFVDGWLQGQKDWGRPNDVLFTPNGELLISDDKGGAIWRVSYTD